MLHVVYNSPETLVEMADGREVVNHTHNVPRMEMRCFMLNCKLGVLAIHRMHGISEIRQIMGASIRYKMDSSMFR